MTLQEAITVCDRLKPNACAESDKRRWLSDLDGMIYGELLARHEGAPDSFAGYDDSTDGETVLLVPAPYSDVYLKYLFAQIDFVNGEYARCSNAAMLYNTAYRAFADHIHRTRRPLCENRIREG